MLDKIKAAFLGKSVADRIISEHPNMQLVFTFESIGDQCMELAYLRAYQRENNIGEIGILTTNPDHAVFRFFQNEFDSLIKISPSDYQILLVFYKSDLGQLYRRRETRILCAFYTSYVRSDLLFHNKYIRLSDIEKYIYRLPPQTLPCEIHRIKFDSWINDLIQKSKIVIGKTILLNPYANSCSGVPIYFFERLAVMLQKIGYHVITGVHNQQEAIRGTEEVIFSLDKTIALVDSCEAVIGLRSGFLDLCAFSKTTVVSIDIDSYNIADATRLEDWWPQNTRLKTFRYCKNDEELIDSIIEFLQK